MTDATLTSTNYCPRCGGAATGVSFCPGCGFDLREAARPTPGWSPTPPSPATPPALAPAASSAPTVGGRDINWGGAIALVGGALAIIGAFMPWISATAFLGTISRNGIDGGGDGIFAILVGLVVAFAGIALLARSGRPIVARVTAIVASLFLGWLAIVDMGSVNERVAALNTTYTTGSVGTGLYLLILAAVLGLIGGLVRPSAQR